MNFKLIFNIAIHLIRTPRKQTVAAVVGVIFGIATFITLISFMNGVNNLLDGLTLNRTADIRLYNKIKPSKNQPTTLARKHKDKINFISSVKPKNQGKAIYNSQAIINYVKKYPRSIAVASKINVPVFFNSGNIEISGFVSGIEVASEEKLFKVNDYIFIAKVDDLLKNNSLIVGKGIADKMLLTTRDIIKVTSAKGNLDSLKIVGISQSVFAGFDNTMSYNSLGNAQKLLGKATNYVTGIQIKLFDMQSVQTIVKEFQNKFDIDAIDFQSANLQFETGSTVRNIISYAVGVVLPIVLGFGIYTILKMMIFEKMQSITILKVTGFLGNDVNWIFILLVLVIGVVGGIFGLIFGFIFSSIIDDAPLETASLPTVKTYPINYNPAFYIIGIVFALINTTIAGLLTALKASKVDSVEIIRG